MSIIVTPGKTWPVTGTETIDPADLDAAGQPTFAFFNFSLRTASFYVPGILAKIATAGGPGLRGMLLTKSTSLPPDYTSSLGTLAIPGSAAGDQVLVETPPDLNILCTGYVDASAIVHVSAYNFTASTFTLTPGIELKVMVYHK